MTRLLISPVLTSGTDYRETHDVPAGWSSWDAAVRRDWARSRVADLVARFADVDPVTGGTWEEVG